MEKVYFMTLRPDDYHGAPEVNELTDEYFPIPLDREETYDTWASAGYSYMDSEQDETEEEAFDLYGDQSCFYATYIINLKPGMNAENLSVEITDSVQDEYNDNWGTEIDTSKVCALIGKIPNVISVFSVEFDK